MTKIVVDKALLEQALRAIFPVMGYGLQGTKDTQQHALQKVHAGLTAALAEPAVELVNIDQIASERYKVVPSHDSMFHRWAVVAGDGTQQLYIGREVECQNMARKFAGAFLDGAYLVSQPTNVPLLTQL